MLFKLWFLLPIAPLLVALLELPVAAMLVFEIEELLRVFCWFSRSLIFELFEVWLEFTPDVDILILAFKSRF